MHELHEEEEEDMYNEVKLKSNEAVTKSTLFYVIICDQG